jgi:hypothetical protein
MKAVRLFDIIIQIFLMCILLWCYNGDSHLGNGAYAGYLLIGLWQLISCGILSWPNGNIKLRLIYGLMLLVVFSPLIIRLCNLKNVENLKMSDSIYYSLICPVVMGYYSVVCMIEYFTQTKQQSL